MSHFAGAKVDKMSDHRGGIPQKPPGDITYPVSPDIKYQGQKVSSGYVQEIVDEAVRVFMRGRPLVERPYIFGGYCGRGNQLETGV